VSLSALTPVLVRRDAQLAALEDALLEARRGHGGLVVLSGEAGIGKTRLASELVRQARRLGSVALLGGCSEAELSLPYLPFVEAIGNYLAEEDIAALAERLGPTAGELSQLFPQFGDGGARELAHDPSQAKLRLFEAIVALLAIPASDHALVLVIEDVHWADDSSRELLDHIARRLTGMRALAVVTYRSDELHRRHPFVPTLRAWRRSGLAEVVELGPLPEAGAAEMIAAITGTDRIEPELVDLLYERSEGNPFFLEEMLSDATSALEGGTALSRVALDEIGIPETVRDTILQRLARLDREYAPTLEAAAVLGRSFDYRTLQDVSEADAAVVQSALEAAVAAQLVEEHPDAQGRYRWRHALTQEAIYDDIVTPRRQAIHSRAADVLAAATATPPVDVAHHLLGAGRFDEAVPICLESAGEAERAAAFRQAAGLLERALPHIDDPLEHGLVVCRIGHDYALNGEPGIAVGFLSDGIDALEGLGEALATARYRVILGRCFWERSRPDLARTEYEGARDLLTPAGASADLAMAYVRLAGLYAFELDYHGCLEAARKAVEIAEAAGAESERLYALGFVGLGYLDAGAPDRGFEVMDACYEEAIANDYWHVAQNVTWNDIWTRVHLLRGGLEPLLERYSRMPSVPLIALTATSSRSYVNKARGALQAAREDAELGIGLNERLGYRKMVWRCQVHLAEILVELGRYDEAKDVLPPTSARTELQDLVYDAEAQIRSRLARGEIADALVLAREVLSRGNSLTAYRGPLAVAVEAFVAGKDLDSAEQAIEHGRANRNAAGEAFLDEMQGRVLLARGDGPGAAGHLRRAVTAAEDAGYPLFALRDRALLAQALGQEGRHEEAARELREVIAEAGPMEARLIVTEALAAAELLGIELPDTSDAPVEPAIEPEILPTGERLVTSLFADVRGYTDLSATDAPGELAERMAALYRFASSTVGRHSGIVDKFAGDAVMATFNISGTTVDHAVDALEAGLTLRDKAALMDLPLGIGIATGAAILGAGASGANIAVRGMATNLAARLQVAAGPGEILLSEEAHKRAEPWLRERAVQLERVELNLKGFEAKQVGYRLPAPAGLLATEAA
jgi:class 3 adenylate cyclase